MWFCCLTLQICLLSVFGIIGADKKNDQPAQGPAQILTSTPKAATTIALPTTVAQRQDATTTAAALGKQQTSTAAPTARPQTTLVATTIGHQTPIAAATTVILQTTVISRQDTTAAPKIVTTGAAAATTIAAKSPATSVAPKGLDTNQKLTTTSSGATTAGPGKQPPTTAAANPNTTNKTVHGGDEKDSHKQETGSASSAKGNNEKDVHSLDQPAMVEHKAETDNGSNNGKGSDSGKGVAHHDDNGERHDTTTSSGHPTTAKAAGSEKDVTHHGDGDERHETTAFGGHPTTAKAAASERDVTYHNHNGERHETTSGYRTTAKGGEAGKDHGKDRDDSHGKDNNGRDFKTTTAKESRAAPKRGKLGKHMNFTFLDDSNANWEIFFFLMDIAENYTFTSVTELVTYVRLELEFKFSAKLQQWAVYVGTEFTAYSISARGEYPRNIIRMRVEDETYKMEAFTIHIWQEICSFGLTEKYQAIYSGVSISDKQMFEVLADTDSKMNNATITYIERIVTNVVDEKISESVTARNIAQMLLNSFGGAWSVVVGNVFGLSSLYEVPFFVGLERSANFTVHTYMHQLCHP